MLSFKRIPLNGVLMLNIFHNERRIHMKSEVFLRYCGSRESFRILRAASVSSLTTFSQFYILSFYNRRKNKLSWSDEGLV